MPLETIGPSIESGPLNGNFAYLNGLLGVSSLLRQALINGSFDVWQRGTTFPISGGGGYTADRWFARRNGSALGLTVSRQPGGIGRYCIRLQRDVGNTATNYAWMSQLIETANTIPFRGRQVSLRFRARKGADYSQSQSVLTAAVRSGTDVDGTFSNSGGSINGEVTLGSTSVVLTTNWQDFEVSCNAVPANANLLSAKFETRSGANEFTGVAGANDYVEIELVGLNAGDVALPVQPRSYGEELALCQRYYEKSYNIDTSPGTITAGGVLKWESTGSSYSGFMVQYKVTKRINPTFVIYSPNTGTPNNIFDQNTGADLTAAAEVAQSCTRILVVNIITNTGDFLSAHWTADAEL
ncbi:hypothetical protein COLU111180_04070 [Cohnella lubricantis]